MRGYGVQGCFSPEGRPMKLPTLHFRTIWNDTQGGVISCYTTEEGLFLFVWPFELALLWPGVEV